MACSRPGQGSVWSGKLAKDKLCWGDSGGTVRMQRTWFPVVGSYIFDILNSYNAGTWSVVFVCTGVHPQQIHLSKQLLPSKHNNTTKLTQYLVKLCESAINMVNIMNNYISID